MDDVFSNVLIIIQVIQKSVYEVVYFHGERGIMKRCSVAFCYNHRLVSSKFFYRFPKNLKYKQKWIEFVKKTRSEWPVDNHVNVSEVICEDHFHREDFHNYYQYQLGFSTQLRLRATAVPSLPPKNEEVPPIVLKKSRRKRNKPKNTKKSSKSQKSKRGRNVNRKQESSSSSSSSSKAQCVDHLNTKEELIESDDGVSEERMFEMVWVKSEEVSVCSELDGTIRESTLLKRDENDMSGTLVQIHQEHNYARKGSDVHTKLKVLSPDDVNSLISTVIHQDVAEHVGTCVTIDAPSSEAVLKEQTKFIEDAENRRCVRLFTEHEGISHGRESLVNLGVTIKQERTVDAQSCEQEFPTVGENSQGRNARSVKNISLVRDEDMYDASRFVKQEECEQNKGEFGSGCDHMKKETESHLLMGDFVCDRDNDMKEKAFPLEKNQFICDRESTVKQEKTESVWDPDEYEFHPIGKDILCVEGIKQEKICWTKDTFVSGLEGIMVQESRDSDWDSYGDAEKGVSASSEAENILLELEDTEKEEEVEEYSSEQNVVVSQECQSMTIGDVLVPDKHVIARKDGQAPGIGQDDDLQRTCSVTQSKVSTDIPLGKLKSIFVDKNCSYIGHKLGKDWLKSSTTEYDIKRTQAVTNDQEDHILDLHDEYVNQVKGAVQLDMRKLQEDIGIKTKNELNNENDMEKSVYVDSTCVVEPNATWRGVTGDTWQRRASTRRRKKPLKFLDYGEIELSSLAAMQKPLRKKKQDGSLNHFPKSKKLQKKSTKYSEDEICKGCKKLYDSSDKLKNHHNKHPVLSCNFCSKAFCDPVTYRVHIMAHIALKKSCLTPELQVDRKRIMNILNEGGDYGVAYEKNKVSTAQTKGSSYSSSFKNPEGSYFKSSFS